MPAPTKTRPRCSRAPCQTSQAPPLNQPDRLLHSEAGRARLRRGDPTLRNDRRLPLPSQQRQKGPLTCAFEPEVGFEPTTFRLRDGCSASIWTATDGSSLLTLDALSVQTAPDGSRRIVWMIKWMIKAHPTQSRMARQAVRCP